MQIKYKAVRKTGVGGPVFGTLFARNCAEALREGAANSIEGVLAHFNAVDGHWLYTAEEPLMFRTTSVSDGIYTDRKIDQSHFEETTANGFPRTADGMVTYYNDLHRQMNGNHPIYKYSVTPLQEKEKETKTMPATVPTTQIDPTKNKINAIKAVRIFTEQTFTTGIAGLKASKEFVDAVCAEFELKSAPRLYAIMVRDLLLKAPLNARQDIFVALEKEAPGAYVLNMSRFDQFDDRRLNGLVF